MLQFFLVVLAMAMQAGGPAQPTSAANVVAAAAPQATALQAEPQTPTGRFTTATEVKPILNATRGSWVAVRVWEGRDLLYVTQLWSWRCGLLEMKIGINGAPPEVWPLPKCHMSQPMPGTILEEDGLPYREYGLNEIKSIVVELLYDDLSTDRAEFNRADVLTP